MVPALFIKECRQILKSILYWVFLGVILVFYTTQLGMNFAGDDIQEAKQSTVYNFSNPLMEPPQGLENYGTRSAEIPEQVMPAATYRLWGEYSENKYLCYPIGFYKNVRLNDSQQERIAQIIEEITGQTPEQLGNTVQKAFSKFDPNLPIFENSLNFSDFVPIRVSYEQFKAYMAEIDSTLGGGSGYALENLASYGHVPVTYEEKAAEQKEIITMEKVTRPYARLFCDYMGIVCALFSVFVPVAFLLRDRRAGCAQLIASRCIPSACLILIRYLAVLTMLTIPFFLLSLPALVELAVYGASQGWSVDYLAFVKYIFAWLVPTLMFCTSVGFFFTILTDTPIGVALMFLYSMFSIFTANGLSSGQYGLSLAIRHNNLWHADVIHSNFEALCFNRLFYVAVSLVLIAATVILYELKRREKLDVYGKLQKIISRVKGSVPTRHRG